MSGVKSVLESRVMKKKLFCEQIDLVGVLFIATTNLTLKSSQYKGIFVSITDGGQSGIPCHTIVFVPGTREQTAIKVVAAVAVGEPLLVTQSASICMLRGLLIACIIVKVVGNVKMISTSLFMYFYFTLKYVEIGIRIGSVVL